MSIAMLFLENPQPDFKSLDIVCKYYNLFENQFNGLDCQNLIQQMLKYKRLSSYLQSLIEKNTQIKSIVYAKDFPFNVPSSFSLFSTCLNNLNEFEQFKMKIQQASKVDISNKYLFFVMLAEFINTGKIVGGGKIRRIIVQNADKLKIPIKSKIIKSNVQIRVRNNEQIEALAAVKNDKHIQGVYDLSYEDYSNLRNNHQQLFDKKIIVQSKSSCLPAWLLFQDLNINGKIDIIDCCAAPGNKTIQLSQYLSDHGKVRAFEKNQARYSVLTNRIRKYQIKNVKTYNEDYLLSYVQDSKFKKVKLILADPSCSGSGMLVNFSNHKIDQSLSFQQICQNVYQNLSNQQKQRVQKLKQFQLQILNHCAQFRPVRIAYSTCSIYEKENQQVVKQFLEAHHEYRIKKRPSLIDDLPRGFGTVGYDCVRMSPIGKITDGFFVCIFKLRQCE